jgi:hypothetical protein
MDVKTWKWLLEVFHIPCNFDYAVFNPTIAKLINNHFSLYDVLPAFFDLAGPSSERFLTK